MILFPIIFTAVVILTVIVALGLRSWGREESRVEGVLDSPATHAVSYVVPSGQDPAILVAALHHAGFESRAHMNGGDDVLRVACKESETAQVRSIIEHVDRTGFNGVPMHVTHARFVGET